MGERRKRCESSDTGMNTAVTAMKGMSGRKKVCQRSLPPRARNVTMMSTMAQQAVTKRMA